MGFAGPVQAWPSPAPALPSRCVTAAGYAAKAMSGIWYTNGWMARSLSPIERMGCDAGQQIEEDLHPFRCPARDLGISGAKHEQCDEGMVH